MSSARSTRFVARALLVILAAALLALRPPASHAASVDVACDAAALVSAVGAANASGDADTLRLAPGCTYTLARVDNDVAGPNGLPFITSKLTIEGNGATIARSSAAGTPAFRIMTIGGTGTVTLSNLTLAGGRTSDGAPGVAGGLGGGILNTGVLTITGGVIRDNATGAGGAGVAGGTGELGGGGGGIGNTGTLTLINSTVRGNTTGPGGPSDGARGGSGGFGGGILSTGAVRLVGSTVSGNATSAGGAGSSIGAGGSGGGIASIASSSSLTLAGSTVSGNTTSAGGAGGGIFSAGAVTLTSSTISANTAAANGGGIRNSGGGVTSVNTLIAGNSDASGANPDISGAVTSQGYNLIGTLGNTSFPSNTTGDQYGDPGNTTVPNAGAKESTTPIGAGLAALANNGGPTQTHRPLTRSAGVDQGLCAGQVADQRGWPRPYDILAVANAAGGDACDIGAVEAVSIAYLPLASR